MWAICQNLKGDCYHPPVKYLQLGNSYRFNGLAFLFLPSRDYRQSVFSKDPSLGSLQTFVLRRQLIHLWANLEFSRMLATQSWDINPCNNIWRKYKIFFSLPRTYNHVSSYQIQTRTNIHYCSRAHEVYFDLYSWPSISTAFTNNPVLADYTYILISLSSE